MSRRHQSTLERLETVLEFIEGRRDYWPLTLRGIHYGLLNVLPGYQNTRYEYQGLSRLLTWAREEEKLDWSAMEDRSRPENVPRVFRNEREYLESEIDLFLGYFAMDVTQTQPRALEVMVEKDTLQHLVAGVAEEYGLRCEAGRGFTSTDRCRKLADRVRARWTGERRRTHILYFGDLDPSGVHMLPGVPEVGTERSLLTKLKTVYGLGDLITGEMCALTVDQVQKFNLPFSLDAIKIVDQSTGLVQSTGKRKGDSRAPRYMGWLGSIGEDPKLAVELDALDPAQLQAIVKEAIESNLDLSQVEKLRRRERRLEAKFAGLKRRILPELRGLVGLPS